MKTGMYWMMLGTEPTLKDEIRLAVMHYYTKHLRFPSWVDMNLLDNPDGLIEASWKFSEESVSVKVSNSPLILPGHLLVGINED